MKRLLAVIVGGIMALSVSACGAAPTVGTAGTTDADSEAVSPPAPAEGEIQAKSDSQITVGVILKATNAEYWQRMTYGAGQAAKDLGIKVTVAGPASETAFSEQSNMIETMLSSGQADAMCLAPLQTDMVITKLQNAKIPVVFVDTDAPYDQKVSYVGTSNEEAAKMGGEYAAKLLGEGKKAVLIGAVQGEPTCEARIKGYQEGLEAGGVQILGVQYANAETDQAVSVMENFMQRFPEIDAVLCHNDEMAVGAQRAAAQAGRADKIKFIGFNGESAACQSILDGKETASVSQDAEDMAYKAVEAAVKAIKGEPVDKTIITPATMITKEYAKESLDKIKSELQ